MAQLTPNLFLQRWRPVTEAAGMEAGLIWPLGPGGMRVKSGYFVRSVAQPTKWHREPHQSWQHLCAFVCKRLVDVFSPWPNDDNICGRISSKELRWCLRAPTVAQPWNCLEQYAVLRWIDEFRSEISANARSFHLQIAICIAVFRGNASKWLTYS